MKKILSSLIVIALLFVCSAPAMGAALTDKKYSILNDAGGSLTTLVPIALIIPNKSRVIKVTVTTMKNPSAGTECLVAIYDASSISGLIDTKAMEGEIESDGDKSAVLEWKRCLKIYNGCVIGQGAYTVVNIEYEDVPQP